MTDYSSNMEEQIGALQKEISRTHRILHGDPGIGVGVLARLADIENKHTLMMQQIGHLTDAIQEDREQRKHETAIQMAVEQAREETMKKLFKLVQVFGPLLGGGLGVNILLELLKLI